MVLLSGPRLLFFVLLVSRLSSPCLYGGSACASARTSALGSRVGHGEGEERRLTDFPRTPSHRLVHPSLGGNHTAIAMLESRDAARATFYRRRVGRLAACASSNCRLWQPCPHSRAAHIPQCARSRSSCVFRTPACPASCRTSAVHCASPISSQATYSPLATSPVGHRRLSMTSARRASPVQCSNRAT